MDDATHAKHLANMKRSLRGAMSEDLHHLIGSGRGRTRPHPRAHRRREGGPEDSWPLSWGKGSFGFRPDENGRLVEFPEEQEAIALIRSLKKQGMALRPIADAIRAAGFKISHQGVAEVLKRPQA